MKDNMNNQQQYFDKQLQALFDGINALLAAQTNDQQKVNEAIKQSAELHKSAQTIIHHLSKNVPKLIKDAAHESSNTITDTVLEKLQHINEKANATVHVFDNSTKRLGLKIFVMEAAVLMLCFSMMLFFIYFYVPSFDEIEKRRTELKQLNTRIEKLESIGARAQIRSCKINSKSLPCIRTDERQDRNAWGEGEETYRLIWQSK